MCVEFRKGRGKEGEMEGEGEGGRDKGGGGGERGKDGVKGGTEQESGENQKYVCLKEALN